MKIFAYRGESLWESGKGVSSPISAFSAAAQFVKNALERRRVSHFRKTADRIWDGFLKHAPKVQDHYILDRELNILYAAYAETTEKIIELLNGYSSYEGVAIIKLLSHLIGFQTGTHYRADFYAPEPYRGALAFSAQVTLPYINDFVNFVEELTLDNFKEKIDALAAQIHAEVTTANKKHASSPIDVQSVTRALIIAGPSGSGKTSLITRLLHDYPEHFTFPPLTTTREPRHGEVPDEYRIFVSTDVFEQLLFADRLCMVRSRHGHWYGMDKSLLEGALRHKRIILLDTTSVETITLMKHSFPKAYSVLVSPLSSEEFSTMDEDQTRDLLRIRMEERDSNIAALELNIRLEEAVINLFGFLRAVQFDTMIKNENGNFEAAYQQFKTFALFVRDAASSPVGPSKDKDALNTPSIFPSVPERVSHKEWKSEQIKGMADCAGLALLFIIAPFFTPAGLGNYIGGLYFLFGAPLQWKWLITIYVIGMVAGFLLRRPFQAVAFDRQQKQERAWWQMQQEKDARELVNKIANARDKGVIENLARSYFDVTVFRRARGWPRLNGYLHTFYGLEEQLANIPTSSLSLGDLSRVAEFLDICAAVAQRNKAVVSDPGWIQAEQAEHLVLRIHNIEWDYASPVIMKKYLFALYDCLMRCKAFADGSKGNERSFSPLIADGKETNGNHASSPTEEEKDDIYQIIKFTETVGAVADTDYAWAWRLYEEYKRQKGNLRFGRALIKALHILLFDKNKNIRMGAAWIISQPEFLGPVLGASVSGWNDRSVLNVISSIYIDSPRILSEFFSGLDTNEGRDWMLDQLLSAVIHAENEKQKEKALETILRISNFNLTPLNISAHDGRLFDSLRSGIIRPGEEGKVVVTKYDPFRVAISCRKIDGYHCNVYLNLTTGNGARKILSKDDATIDEVNPNLYSWDIETEAYDGSIDVDLVMMDSTKTYPVVIAHRHFDYIPKIIPEGVPLDQINYQPVPELRETKVLVLGMEAMLLRDSLFGAMAGGYGILEGSYLRALRFSGAECVFPLLVYRTGAQQVMTAQGPIVEYGPLDYSKIFNGHEDEIEQWEVVDEKEVTFTLCNKPVTTKVTMVRLLIKGVSVASLIPFIELTSEIEDRLYPKGHESYPRFLQAAFYSRAVLALLEAFAITPDIVQVHEAFPAVSLLPDLFQHPFYAGNPRFASMKENIIGFSHTLVPQAYPKFESHFIEIVLGLSRDQYEPLLTKVTDKHGTAHDKYDPFYALCQKAKAVGTVGLEARKAISKDAVYGVFADKYFALEDSIWTFPWMLDEQLARGGKVLEKDEIWPAKESAETKMLAYLRDTWGIELVAGRPTIVEARRLVDFKWNTFFLGMPGSGVLQGLYYLTADPQEGGLGFNVIIAGMAHEDPSNVVPQAWEATFRDFMQDERLKGRFAYVPWNTEVSEFVIKGAKASFQTSIPPYEAAGMKDKKDKVAYNVVVSSYTGGPVQQDTNVLIHGTRGNGYLFEPYSPIRLQRALEDLSARLHAYIYTQRGVQYETVAVLPNKYWAGLATRYMCEDPEGILQIMHNAGRMLPVVDSRTAAMKFALLYAKLLNKKVAYGNYQPFLAQIMRNFSERIEVIAVSSPVVQMAKPLHVLLGAPECVLYGSKKGGLADVVGGLAKMLTAGNDRVTLVTLAYQSMLDGILKGKQAEDEFMVAFGQEQIPVQILHDDRFNFDAYFGYHPIYTYELYAGDLLRQAVILSRFIERLSLQLRPDLDHLHDWMTALAAAYIHFWIQGSALPKMLYHVHNLGAIYQGRFGQECMPLTGLGWDVFRPIGGIEFYGGINLTKAGLIFADASLTVSRRYAQEIQTPEFGVDLDEHMRALAEEGRLGGIIDAIDHDTYDPSTDPHLAVHYTVDTAFEGKGLNKLA
ncbi:MAG: glycogen/starch synthase, partial [Candidatus Omnitrophica bacterium]|nr:glycogen/starch synthase [Candidatus Omnitrophota bacterium]